MSRFVYRRRLSRPDEDGSTLLLAIVAVVTMSLIFAAIAGYAAVNERTVSAYRDLRSSRYAGEAAVNTAINWAADTYNTARDPALGGNQDCLVHVPTDVGMVTANCEADAGSDSGKPNEAGLNPEEALVLLGDRLEEPGPYNAEQCKGWWNVFTGFFNTAIDPGATGSGEASGFFRVRTGLGGFIGSSCTNDRNRAAQPFIVDGDLAARGRINVESGSAASVSQVIASGNHTDGSPHTVAARRGCTPNKVTPSCSTTVGTRSDGSAKDTDPARTAPAAADALGGIKESWLPVNFNSDGSLRTSYSGQKFPVRTTPYLWSPGTTSADPTIVPNGLAAAPTNTCAGTSATMVFLPGWYKDAEVLNRYTTNAGCTGATFWFAPDPGPDKVLLTDDDVTGSFYFDFRHPSTLEAGRPCGNAPMPALKYRWCIGGSSSNNVRVVAGIPKDWSPLGAAVEESPGVYDPTRVQVRKDTATTVDKDLSLIWYDAEKAKKIDGQWAHYQPAWCLLFTCPSIDRSIRVRGFTPKVTGPPISDVGYDKGRIFVEIQYGLVNGASLDDPTLDINAVTNESGDVNCGTYTLPKLVYDGSPTKYTFTDAQAKQLADACGSVDLINGLEFTMKTRGNFWNSGTPMVYLDGISFFYDSFKGAEFPNPVQPAAGGNPGIPAARSDCDTTTPGAQLLFGGESHVYVADGSLEVCGGPYPTDPEAHQVIGVYGVPAVGSIPVGGVSNGGSFKDLAAGSTSGTTWGSYGLSSPNNAQRIDGREALIRYGGVCIPFIYPDLFQNNCPSSQDGTVKLAMQQYTPPPGYTVSKIEARVSYNPKNGCLGALNDCDLGLTANPRLKTNNNCYVDLPKNPDRGPLQVANAPTLVLYGPGAPNPNCFTPADLASATDTTRTLTYAARANCFLRFCKSWTDTLDGVELSITLQPTDTTQAHLIPQSGCIVAHPNYGSGAALPDCALIRADISAIDDNAWPFDESGEWRGRMSVKGTLYAPSSAVEIDDTDYAYTLATRGAVLRHLRISGWGPRSNYSGPAIANEAEKTPEPRVATFVACVQNATRRTNGEPCSAADGDTLLTRARVRFDIDPDPAIPAALRARVPRIEWWSTEV